MNRSNTFRILALASSIGFILAATPAPAGSDPLASIRNRLRSEAGIAHAVESSGEDIPLVKITVLKGDTYGRISKDMTGGAGAAKLIRKSSPKLVAGREIHIPREVLLPNLSDPTLVSLEQGKSFKTLWSLAANKLNSGKTGVKATIRNIQRLNGIRNPSKLYKGQKIKIPRSLLSGNSGWSISKTKLPEISGKYKVKRTGGLARKPRPGEFPKILGRKLRREGQWAAQLSSRKPQLVVIHSTEHGKARFENVAKYLKKKRLANFLIGPDGEIHEIVPVKYRAYGCGPSLWNGLYIVDHQAINIEIYANTAPTNNNGSINDKQYKGLRGLLSWINAKFPGIHSGRVVTHTMVSLNYKTDTRSRKGDPFKFDWKKAGLPDNSLLIDQDVLIGRAKLCTDERFQDRVTKGQTTAAKMVDTL